MRGFKAGPDPADELPHNLPAPPDDGACDHLPGTRIPSLLLPSTTGGPVDLATIPGVAVVYCYPRTGWPDPEGWNEIPGAVGCTPQSCGFRDHYTALRGLGVEVFGLSTQTADHQRELQERLHLPFDLLSDAGLRFSAALRLPTFRVESMTLLKRLTMIIREGRIEKVFYPVFPPERNAGEVLAWLSRTAEGRAHDAADLGRRTGRS